MSEIVIMKSDQGRTVEVHQEDSILIRLDENPTTGYRWKVCEINKQILEFQNSYYTMAHGAGLGGGGTRTILFRAKSIGDGQIQLRLRRSWEPENVFLEHFEITIIVKTH